MEASIQTPEIVPLILIGTLVMITLAFTLVILYNNQQRKIVRQQLTAQERELQYQQELFQKSLMTQEEERRRIAADLHDEIGSKLNVLHLNFHRIKKIAPENDVLTPIWEDISYLLNQTIETTRRISHDLLPPILEDMGLIEALEELSKQLKHSESLEIQFECNIQREQVEASIVKLNVFRIVQELVSNSIKHAKASNIMIELYENENIIHLAYSDNGQGFDPDNNHKAGLGLRNLYNRVKILNGKVNVQTALGEGFKCHVMFQPFHQQQTQLA